MYPVMDQGLYVMPSPEVDWLTMDCRSCAGLGQAFRAGEGLGEVTRPPTWKIATALGLSAAVVYTVMLAAGKKKSRQSGGGMSPWMLRRSRP